MRKLEDTLTTDDLVNSLLASVSERPPPSSPHSSSHETPSVPIPPPRASLAPSSEIEPSIETPDHATEKTSSTLTSTTPSPISVYPIPPPPSLPPLNPAPETTLASDKGAGVPNSTTNSSTNSSTNAKNSDKSSSGGAALSVGIAVGILILVVAALLFLRSRKRRSVKSRASFDALSAGAAALRVPTDRGFQHEHDLGLPEMSIELSPGNLGLSKGFDTSFASSTRSSQSTSFQPNTSVASSTDSSVFNTKGGVSPTTAFCSRKVGGSFSYQYRESEDEKRPIAADLAASTTFHLTGLIGNGQTSGRGGGGGGGLNQSRVAKSGRKLSAPDEYAELVTTTNAHGNVDHLMHPRGSPMREMVMQADFTQSGSSQNELEVSMGPDGDNFSFVAPLPVKRAPVMAVRASDESLGPDSPLARSGRRPGLAYDALSSVSRDKRSALRHQQMGTEVDLNAMSTVSFLSESSISSTSTSDSMTTSLHVSGHEPCMPLLQQLSSADDSDYGEEIVSGRVSLASSEDAKMARSGSLIALKLEANSGSSEIAI